MRELPVDPITGQKDWMMATGDDPNSASSEQGVIDVHSASGDIVRGHALQRMVGHCRLAIADCQLARSLRHQFYCEFS